MLFVLQRFCKDVVVGVSRSKLMQDFNLTLRTQVFESIMRQDQVYFDINGADYARRHLKRQREMDSEADSDGDWD